MRFLEYSVQGDRKQNGGGQGLGGEEESVLNGDRVSVLPEELAFLEPGFPPKASASPGPTKACEGHFCVLSCFSYGSLTIQNQTKNSQITAKPPLVFQREMTFMLSFLSSSFFSQRELRLRAKGTHSSLALRFER